MLLAELESTRLTSLDPFDLAKDDLARALVPPELLQATQILLGQAEEKKARPEEVRSWAEKGFKTAELYGPRLQRETALNYAEALASQEGYGDIALTYAHGRNDSWSRRTRRASSGVSCKCWPRP